MPTRTRTPGTLTRDPGRFRNLWYSLVNILLTVSLLPKIPAEVVSDIRAAAYILDDDIVDNISEDFAKAVSTKVNASLEAITNKFE